MATAAPADRAAGIARGRSLTAVAEPVRVALNARVRLRVAAADNVEATDLDVESARAAVADDATETASVTEYVTPRPTIADDFGGSIACAPGCHRLPSELVQLEKTGMLARAYSSYLTYRLSAEPAPAP